jgi:alkylation response protein AidB-like acyl-CoA dehydrogenase
MEFELDEQQRAIAEAAAAVFSGSASPERVAQVESTPDRFDEELWSKLADANLLGLAVPEEHGGSGLGMSEICVVLEAQGRAVAPVPLWATTVLGAVPIARFGTDDQKRRWLPGVVSGDTRLSAALTEVHAVSSAGAGAVYKAVTARRDGTRWLLDGTLRNVPQAHLAAAVLVPAAAEDRLVVFLVETSSKGVELERAVTTDRQVHPCLRLESVAVGDDQVLGGVGDATVRGGQIVEWMLDRARTGLCAIALGVCEEAVRRTASFLNERHQFGRPLSTFQATMLKEADAYMDTEAIRVTLWNAAWRLDTGRDSQEAVAAANWWASEAGQRVVHTTQHLHGGIGADIEYPIHRYFLWGKQIELMLGSPSSELARLGSMVARSVSITAAGHP